MVGDSDNGGTLDIRWERMERGESGRSGFLPIRPKVGARFGKFVVVSSEYGKRSKSELKCDCGRFIRVCNRTIRGYSESTGMCHSCASKPKFQARKKYRDLFNDREYAMWSHRYSGMVRRCYNLKCIEYRNYGARGIEVWAEWRKDRRKWVEYATTLEGGQDEGLDMDRIDNDKGYVPGNIRLVTRTENSRNRRTTKYICYKDIRYTYSEFIELFLGNWKSTNAFYFHVARGRSAEWIVAKHDEGSKGVRSPKLR